MACGECPNVGIGCKKVQKTLIMTGLGFAFSTALHYPKVAIKALVGTVVAVGVAYLLDYWRQQHDVHGNGDQQHHTHDGAQEIDAHEVADVGFTGEV